MEESVNDWYSQYFYGTMKRLLLLIAGLCALFFQACQDPELVWHEGEGHRWAEVVPEKEGSTLFERLDSTVTGIAKINSLTREQIIENRHLLNGSGVTIGDVDNDGWADIYVSQLNGPNALYKNLGNWRFKDIAGEAGVACADQFSTGCTFADIDGDGDLDLLVLAIGGPNACFLNDGKGVFTDFSKESGIMAETGSMSLALADTDGDGDLDLYIANNKKKTVKDLYPAALRSIERTVKQTARGSYEVIPEFKMHYRVEVDKDNMLSRYEFGEADAYLLNDGTGRFLKTTFNDGWFTDENGKSSVEPTDWGLSVRFQDMDDDGDPDLYICNDFESPDRIWINNGDGTFKALPKMAMRNVSASSMGIDYSDIDRDGNVDFFLTEMLSRSDVRRKKQQGPVSMTKGEIGVFDDRPQYMRNSLFLNRGDGSFAEIAQFANIAASEWSWAPLFLDADLDGYEDLFITSGHFYDAMDMDAKMKISRTLARQTQRTSSEVFDYPMLETRNTVFQNKGDLAFEDKGKAWGFNQMDISHGMASGDLDNDGDLDIVYNSLNAPAGVYRNNAVAPRIAVKLKGAGLNTQGTGAKISVLGSSVPQSKEVYCGGPYLSGAQALYTFAGSTTAEMSIKVVWRSGATSTIKNAKSNRIYEIFEREAMGNSEKGSVADTISAPLFRDVSSKVPFTHYETNFNDFARQPLLPLKLSQIGPALAWLDIDDNGKEDLFITNGKEGFPTIFNNLGGENFRKSTIYERHFMRAKDDQLAAIGFQTDPKYYSLFIGFANYETTTEPSSIAQYVFEGNQIRSKKVLPFPESSLGALAAADFDNDGDLDLFAAGRVVAGRYPQPASSFFYRNEQGEFKLDEDLSGVTEKIGMVTGAVFSDIDGDNDMDLVLSIEWGPVTILENTGLRFENATEKFGLSKLTGRWQAVCTVDMNNDGRLDIVATNWGTNSFHKPSSQAPLKLYYSDFDRNGTLDIIEAFYDFDGQKYKPLVSLASIGTAVPFLASRLKTHETYSTAGLEKMLGYRLRSADSLSIITQKSTIFINEGTQFLAEPLPPAAQFSPAMGVAASDFNGDGHEDVLLSQNFFATNGETARFDGGLGLLLQGNGTGKLKAVPAAKSGIRIYGEQRSIAIADFNDDRRIDFAIAQNGAAVKLFENNQGVPGLRVKIKGSKSNPAGIGAQVRLLYSNTAGPIREVRMGSGFSGRHHSTIILGRYGSPKSVQIKWPDGSMETVKLEKGQEQVGFVFSSK